MPFLTFNKVKVNFAKKKLIKKTYTIAEILLIIKKVQIIDLKKFAKAILNTKQETFVVYIAIFSVESMTMHLDCKVEIASLIIDKAFITIRVEYLSFVDVFFKECATMLPKHIEINTYTIDLKEDKQQSYGLIYSLCLVELETLKTYIETNLANCFIWPSK